MTCGEPPPRPSSIAPQASARRPTNPTRDGAARTPTAADELADAISLIAGHVGETDPMLSAHLVLALAMIARRLDRIYEYLSL